MCEVYHVWVVPERVLLGRYLYRNRQNFWLENHLLMQHIVLLFVWQKIQLLYQLNNRSKVKYYTNRLESKIYFFDLIYVLLLN